MDGVSEVNITRGVVNGQNGTELGRVTKMLSFPCAVTQNVKLLVTCLTGRTVTKDVSHQQTIERRCV